MLKYTIRIRDLVHGTILFTKEEMAIIDSPYFQRLRHVRQNDVAFSVYPSANTSRFEHALGTCRVAGMMAENLTKSPKWERFLKEFSELTGIGTNVEFVQLCRMYALVHDIGHFPLSHLFEQALEDWAKSPLFVVHEWTGKSEFTKLHEALGAVVVEQLAPSIPQPYRDPLVRLMSEKTIRIGDPLSIVKTLIDAEIDADRIDFVQRDGLLAGGEYGHYDIRRLCDAIFLDRDARGWVVGYSEKALTAMEALLLDRYRIHTWVQFHHRVVAMKMLVRYLIQAALERGLIEKSQFDPSRAEFLFRDDVWLWSLLRAMDSDTSMLSLVQRAVFAREKGNVLPLWKSRTTYHACVNEVMRRARIHTINYGIPHLYRDHLTRKLDVQAFTFKVPFRTLGVQSVPLYSEDKPGLTGAYLREASQIVSNLERIWLGEPQEYIILVGEGIASRMEIRRKWMDATVRWIAP